MMGEGRVEKSKAAGRPPHPGETESWREMERGNSREEGRTRELHNSKGTEAK